MFKLFSKKEWKPTSTHLLLLSKFNNGGAPQDYSGDNRWKDVLQESPQKVFKRFFDEEMLGFAGVEEKLDYKFKATQLKQMLKERDLKVSGKKADLIQRLIKHASDEMTHVTSGIELYCCTMLGKNIVKEYLEKEDSKKIDTEKIAFESLKNRDLFKAIEAVVQYEASQVFPRGLGEDWKNYDFDSCLFVMKVIFEITPKLLEGIEAEKLDKLRVAAAMMELWGTNTTKPWLPDGFATGLNLDASAASRMLLFHSSHLRNLKIYQEGGIKKCEILGVGDNSACDNCKKLNGRKFKIGNTPELPYPKCTSESGCRCTTVCADY